MQKQEQKVRPMHYISDNEFVVFQNSYVGSVLNKDTVTENDLRKSLLKLDDEKSIPQKSTKIHVIHTNE